MSISKRIVLVLSLCIIVGCGIYLGKYFYDNHKAENDISEIQNLVAKGNSDGEKDELQTETEQAEATPEPERYAPNGMLQGYYDAYLRNNDMVGWIRLAKTKIDYPVMHKSGDNDYYLHRNFEREYQYSGLPFLDGQCDLNAPNSNFIIYAHNMKSGAMFASLMKYEDKSFFENNQIINFDTNYKRGKYQIFAVFATKVGGKNEFKYYEHTQFHNEEEFNNFVNTAKKLSFYNTGVTPQYGEQLLTLSTCSYNTSNERMVVMAKRME